MIGWTRANWIILEGRAIKDGVISLGSSLLNYPANQVLSYVEYVVREVSEDNDAHMNDLYDVALLSGSPREQRRNEIFSAMAAFGGD